MMDETHKNDVSKNDIESIYKDIDFMSKDIGGLKNRFDDMVSAVNKGCVCGVSKVF